MSNNSQSLLVENKNNFGLQPLMFGVSDRLKANVHVTSLTAGVKLYTLFTVPAGYIYVINHMLFYYGGTAPAFIAFHLVSGAEDMYVFGKKSPTSAEFFQMLAQLIMLEGDILKLEVNAATATNTFDATALGYSMKVSV